jgi:hypothetical protein
MARTATQQAGAAAVAASKELTTQQVAGLPAEIAALLPDLVPTNTLEIGGRDVSFPRIKVSHPNQNFVPDIVPPFALYSDLNREDDDKVVLFELPKGKDKPDLEQAQKDGVEVGVLVYVLAMKQGLSANVDSNGVVVPRNTPGATFRSWPAFNADGSPNQDAPRGADTTYNYVVYVPEVDRAEYPHRILMTRSSTQTARTINTYLRALQDRGLPPYVQPFRIWTEKRQRTVDGQEQRWGIYKARPVAPTAEDVTVASTMMESINRLAPEQLHVPVDDDDAVAASGTVNATAEPAI